MEIGATIGHVAPLTITPVVEEFFEHLAIDKLLGKVIVHHLYLGICNSRWNTRSITLVGLRPIIGRAHLQPGIVVYDHLVISTLLFYREGGMMSLPDVGRSRLISERFAGRRGFDQ